MSLLLSKEICIPDSSPSCGDSQKILLSQDSKNICIFICHRRVARNFFSFFSFFSCSVAMAKGFQGLALLTFHIMSWLRDCNKLSHCHIATLLVISALERIL